MWIGIQPLRSWAPGHRGQSGTESGEIRSHEFPRHISAPVGIRSDLSKSAGNGYVSSFPRIFATNGIRADHVNVVNVPRFPLMRTSREGGTSGAIVNRALGRNEGGWFYWHPGAATSAGGCVR
jgi:hypothetical protein